MHQKLVFLLEGGKSKNLFSTSFRDVPRKSRSVKTEESLVFFSMFRFFRARLVVPKFQKSYKPFF